MCEYEGEHGEDFYLGETPAETGAVAFGEGDVGAFGGAVEEGGCVGGEIDAEGGGVGVGGGGECVGGGGGGFGGGVEEPAFGFEFFEVVVGV